MAAEPAEVQDEAARRVYGVLSTGLGEALGEARDAVAGHAALLAEGRLGEFDALLEEFARRRIRIALYGEVKAGKSTLINALAGCEVSPMAFDPLTSLPVRITYGAETVWRVDDRTFTRVDEVGRAMRLGTFEADEIVVETPVDVLRLGGQVDLLDTPGVGSEDRADRISAEVLRSLDAVVLVVRYPALFTRVTRQLMKDLQSDIGKLFVVWNLDADCAELSAEERSRHSEKLREDVAGVHELYLVDARTGLRGQLDSDSSAIADSGLDEFVSALGRFASSDKREITALREAAKRADQWMEEAHVALRARRESLQLKLRQVRARLEKVASAAQAERQASSDQLESFRTAVDIARKKRGGAVGAAASAFRRALRKGRRNWARRGDLEPLRASLAAAAENYADASLAANDEFRAALAQAAQDFGAAFAEPTRQRELLSAEPLAPEDRLVVAGQGRGQWLRRGLWRRWYLPGVAELERVVVARDLAAQESWETAVAERAQREMQSVLDERLRETDGRAAAEAQRIKEETDFEPEEAEAAALERHLPLVEARRGSIKEISKEAWKLVS